MLDLISTAQNNRIWNIEESSMKNKSTKLDDKIKTKVSSLQLYRLALFTSVQIVEWFNFNQKQWQLKLDSIKTFADTRFHQLQLNSWVNGIEANENGYEQCKHHF